MRNPKIVITFIMFLYIFKAYSIDYSDHAEIGRYESSSIIHQEIGNYNRYIEGLKAVQDGSVIETKQVEGKVTMTLYQGPADASWLEIIKTYKETLETKGYDILFYCEASGCGKDFLTAYYDLAPFAHNPGWENSAPITQGNSDTSGILTAELKSKEDTTFVSLIVSQGWWQFPVYKLDVVELKKHEGIILSDAKVDMVTDDTKGDRSEKQKDDFQRMRFGVQAASDFFLGIVFYAVHFELCMETLAMIFDGYPDNQRPDNYLMLGGHIAYLFLFPQNNISFGIGFNAHQGID